MTAYTDDDVTAGTDVAYAKVRRGTNLSAQDCERVVEAVLAAVAPAIAARALREAADDIMDGYATGRGDPCLPALYNEGAVPWLRARAEEVGDE